MKKTLLIVCLVFMLPLIVNAKSYYNLWNSVTEAQMANDAEAENNALTQIYSKAKKAKDYGQMMKAELIKVKLCARTNNGSISSAVQEMEKHLNENRSDKIACALYHCVLGRIYRENPSLGSDHIMRSKAFFKASMSEPKALAAFRASKLDPFVEVRYASKYFDHDLLSIIGSEAGDFEAMHHYYLNAGQRQAAFLSALEIFRNHRPTSEHETNKSHYLQSIDSLIQVYGDLRVCGEAAIEHYNFMVNCSDVTEKDKIDYIHYSLNKWKDYPRMNELRNKELELTAESFAIQIAQNNIAENTPQKVHLIGLCNVSSISMSVYPVNVDSAVNVDLSDPKQYEQIKNSISPIADTLYVRVYAGHPNYDTFKDSFELKGLPKGVYVLEFVSEPKSAVMRQLYLVGMPQSNIRSSQQADSQTSANTDNEERRVNTTITEGWTDNIKPLEITRVTFSHFNDSLFDFEQ